MYGALSRHFDLHEDGLITGFALDRSSPTRILVVEVMIDGIAAAALLANELSHDLVARGADDPMHGYSTRLPIRLLAAAHVVEVRLANSGELVGEAHRPFAPTRAAASALPPGRLDSNDGLWVSGWLRPTTDTDHVVCLRCDGAELMRATADRWTRIRIGSTGHSVPAFEFELPRALADGRSHLIEATRLNGDRLLGSPQRILAYALEEMTALIGGRVHEDRHMRREIVGRLIARSTSMSHYADWRQRFLPESITLEPVKPSLKTAMVRLGETGTGSTPDSPPSGAAIDIALPAGSDIYRFATADLMREVDGAAADCDVFVFTRRTTRIFADTVARLANALLTHPTAAGAYGDFDVTARNVSTPE